MDVKEILLTALAAAAALFLNVKLLTAPFRLSVRVVLNALVGLGALFLVNAATALTGPAPEISLVNAAVVAVLGVPGLGILFLSRWTLA